MGRLLPSLPDATADREADPRVVGLDSDDAETLMGALSSDTARDLLAFLHDEPAAPSELARRLDTTLQNAQYHLRKLEDAGVVEVADTVYSEKGREMKVYAPSDDPLVVVAGGDDATTSLRAALTGLLGAVGLLGVAAFVVQRLFGREPASEPSTLSARTEAMDAAAGSASATSLLTEPGALFFAGGLVVLLLGFAAWYLRR